MKILVHISGGLDSAAVAHRATVSNEPTGIFFNIGQNYVEQERAGAQYVAAHLGIPLLQVHLPFLMTHLAGAARLEYVPQRNLVLGAYSLHAATVLGCEEIWVGTQSEDTFKDNQPQFWSAVAAAGDTGREPGVPPIAFRAPIQSWDKTHVLQYLRGTTLDPKRLWWCYEAREFPCGLCRHCLHVAAAGGV
jgi:7-cyano-7-deazaguanine synthase in queuosine biosynthesis